MKRTPWYVQNGRDYKHVVHRRQRRDLLTELIITELIKFEWKLIKHERVNQHIAHNVKGVFIKSQIQSGD